MTRYTSELLNTEECKLYRKACASDDRNARFMKTDPVMVANVLISLDYARIKIRALESRLAALEAAQAPDPQEAEYRATCPDCKRPYPCDCMQGKFS